MRPLVVALSLAAAGCGAGGPALHPVAGVVLFRGGRPVAAGLVEFAPLDGGPSAQARLNPDGTFTLTTDGRPGIVAGPHRAVVLPMQVADGSPAGHRHKAVVDHPKRARFETSGLAAAVVAGKSNHFTLEVEPAP